MTTTRKEQYNNSIEELQAITPSINYALLLCEPNEIYSIGKIRGRGRSETRKRGKRHAREKVIEMNGTQKLYESVSTLSRYTQTDAHFLYIQLSKCSVFAYSFFRLVCSSHYQCLDEFTIAFQLQQHQTKCRRLCVIVSVLVCAATCSTVRCWFFILLLFCFV